MSHFFIFWKIPYPIIDCLHIINMNVIELGKYRLK